MNTSNRTYIIAEIGGNFTDINTGKILIDQASQCGVDAVKLQTYKADTIVTKNAMFDMEATGVISQRDYFKKYELDENSHRILFEYAKENGLDIFSTPSHYSDVELLEKLKVDTYKIGADDLTNIPLLKRIARLNKPIMLSTGMSTLSEIKEAVDAILEEGNNQITILHVVSLYPTRAEYVNLEAINTLKREFPEFTIGYSDHSLTNDACVFAAVMGAKVIEKHFTYDKKAIGPDHMHSATKEEMQDLVNKIRLFETMRGNGIKAPVSDEVKNRTNNRKSIVFSKDLEANTIIENSCLEIKRPGTGISPSKYNMILGKRLRNNVKLDDIAKWSDFE